MSESLLGSPEPTPTPVPTPEPVSETPPPSWRDTLPDDIKNDTSLSPIQDVASLAKSFVHAQKMIGRDKIVIPDKHATDEDWKGVFKKLGLPEKDKYEVKAEGFDADFVGKFKEFAHENNMLPQQAERLLGWYKDYAGGLSTQSQQQQETQVAEEIKGLKTEWGNAFEKNVSIAQGAFRQFADKETLDYIQNSGLGNDVKLVKLFHSIGLKMGDDQFVGEARRSEGATPQEAQTKVNEILGNRQHPYWNKSHPNHTNAVQEVFGLHEYIADYEKKKTT